MPWMIRVMKVTTATSMKLFPSYNRPAYQYRGSASPYLAGTGWKELMMFLQIVPQSKLFLNLTLCVLGRTNCPDC